ncbi:hypothetical protein KAFR_0C01150 [Kazachstania africana CBS 2517]|uniref:Uncharacterized protein n=1 Tax=Kazachstania africana (strain ATCC 22294 / BCRC 22015 / CBS 2517 / CECT 1963 / NBRC 1671 / NRRL Y-8276) TaxID=1071382 RepID=H2ARW0_KAZAF|nr:hypothetical protein KAFR_0C01150 [Kazachstania africana CBS 2517]CCF57110.1 hypothetical protein KAFR_0C01150 [Kazachstania africana CBS 2517]
MQQALAGLFQQIRASNYDVLSIDLKKNGSLISSLQNELQRFDNRELDKLVESQNFHNGKWTRFNIMILSFLKFSRDVDPWSTWENVDIIFNFYSDLNNCLLNDSYPIDKLIEVFLSITEFIIPFATTLDENYVLLGTRQYQFLSHTSSIISKLFNSIKPHSEANTNGNVLQGKQAILLYLVNKLNNIYFKIDSPQLCSNIFKNFKPKSSIENFSEYPLTQRIEYRYLLGKYYLTNARITNSFVQLNSAFDLLCSAYNLLGYNVHPSIKKNALKILRYLIPAGLIMGKLPNFKLIEALDLQLASSYIKLAHYIREGNIKGLNLWLQHNERDLSHRYLLIIFLEKLPMIAYRYLVRKTIMEWSISQNLNRLPFDVLERMMKLSIGDDSDRPDLNKISIYNGIHNYKNVENVLVTLINLGYLRGNCYPLLKVCVFQKTQNINDVLPPIDERILAMFPLNSEDAWLDN